MLAIAHVHKSSQEGMEIQMAVWRPQLQVALNKLLVARMNTTTAHGEGRLKHLPQEQLTSGTAQRRRERQVRQTRALQTGTAVTIHTSLHAAAVHTILDQVAVREAEEAALVHHHQEEAEEEHVATDRQQT